MAKRRSATRRAVKRSAKRSAKRGAYKSRKNQRNSRGRTQRGGVFGALISKATDAMTAASSNFSAGTALLNVGQSIANIIPKIINGVFSLMVMVYILSAIARNPKAFADSAQEDLKAKLEDLKKRMADFVKGNDALKDCITTFESNIQNAKLNPPSPPPPESNVGKTCIYSPGISTQQGPAKSYQALIVEEWDEAQAAENDYGQPMFLIWVKGGGLTPEIVSKDKIIIVSETEKEFTDLANNSIGQQQVTMEQARAHYELPPPQNTPVAVEPIITPPEQQETPIDILKQRAQEFSQAPNKRQFIIDAVNGYIAASKLRLERVMERVQDPKLKRCIQIIKAELTQQIKSQVAELKSKLPGNSQSHQIHQTVFDIITGLSEGLRDQARGLLGSFRSLRS